MQVRVDKWSSFSRDDSLAIFHSLPLPGKTFNIIHGNDGIGIIGALHENYVQIGSTGPLQ
jgi:hypothetical protein